RFLELPGQVARLLDGPATARVFATGDKDDAPAGQLQEEENVQALEEHGVHREVVAARIALPWARRKRRHVSPARRGAGEMRWRRSSLRTLVAETRWPSLSSSPRMRMSPHNGFSLASLSTNSWHSAGSDGRPGP